MTVDNECVICWSQYISTVVEDLLFSDDDDDDDDDDDKYLLFTFILTVSLLCVLCTGVGIVLASGLYTLQKHLVNFRQVSVYCNQIFKDICFNNITKGILSTLPSLN